MNDMTKACRFRQLLLLGCGSYLVATNLIQFSAAEPTIPPTSLAPRQVPAVVNAPSQQTAATTASNSTATVLPSSATTLPTNNTSPSTSSSSSPSGSVSVPDVALCDCGFIDSSDPAGLVFTSYHHANFVNMPMETLLAGMRPLKFAIDRESSTFQRAFRTEQVRTGPEGVELVVSPATAQGQVPSATLASTGGDFWYGNYHVRAKTSNNTGTVSAFYTYFNDTQECDIEYVGSSDAQRLRFTTKPQHYDPTGRPLPETYQTQWFESPHGESMSDQFRFWSFQWLPDIVRYGLNLTYVRNITREVQKVPGSVLVSHWSDGNPRFSGGPPTQDTKLIVSDIISIYNSSVAKLPLACSKVRAPCLIDIAAKTATVPVSAIVTSETTTSSSSSTNGSTVGTVDISTQPVQTYAGSFANVNGEPIDWHRHKKFSEAKWKVIVVSVCGGVLGIMVAVCLWNFDGFITKLCGKDARQKRKDKKEPLRRRKSAFSMMAAKAETFWLGGGPRAVPHWLNKESEAGLALVPQQQQQQQPQQQQEDDEVRRADSMSSQAPQSPFRSDAATMPSASPFSDQRRAYSPVPNSDVRGGSLGSSDLESAFDDHGSSSASLARFNGSTVTSTSTVAATSRSEHRIPTRDSSASSVSDWEATLREADPMSRPAAQATQVYQHQHQQQQVRLSVQQVRSPAPQPRPPQQHYQQPQPQPQYHHLQQQQQQNHHDHHQPRPVPIRAGIPSSRRTGSGAGFRSPSSGLRPILRNQHSYPHSPSPLSAAPHTSSSSFDGESDSEIPYRQQTRAADVAVANAPVPRRMHSPWQGGGHHGHNPFESPSASTPGSPQRWTPQG